jgi:hypothetical protein
VKQLCHFLQIHINTNILALLIILKQSFWDCQNFWERVDETYEQFDAQNYAQKLKGRVSHPPSGQKKLVDFLLNEVAMH